MSARPMSADTTPRAEAMMLEIYRRMPASRKLALVDDAITTSRRLCMAGLQARHPDDPPERLRRRLLDLILGEDLAAEVYGPFPGRR